MQKYVVYQPPVKQGNMTNQQRHNLSRNMRKLSENICLEGSMMDDAKKREVCGELTGYLIIVGRDCNASLDDLINLVTTVWNKTST